MSKVRTIVFHQYGAPAEVARVEEREIGAPDRGEVRVRLLAAPINPADLNVIEGKYATLPELPGVPGVEGVAVVEELGSCVEQLCVGDRVLLPHGVGTWREANNIPADALHIVPPEVPVEQAAMLKINPATALRMLEDFVQLKPGDWVVQNAANSGVGQSVIQLARDMGLRMLNFVRRPELVDALKNAGADAVLLDEGDPGEQIHAALGDATIRLGFNAVGGESALRVAGSLSQGGTIVTYGAMARKPLKIPNGMLIFDDLTWRGFWVSRWYREGSTREERAAMFSRFFKLAASGALHTKVERIYPLEETAAALTHAAQGRRGGKILFGAAELVNSPSPSSSSSPSQPVAQ